MMDFETMQALQKTLREKYRDRWGDLRPERGRTLLLWAMAECGEVADILKKDGEDAILRDAAVRAHFAEEICDVLMYLTDLLLCFDLTPQELESAYRKKFDFNMHRRQ